MQALRARNDRLAQKVASQKVVIAAQKNVIKKQDRVLNGIAEKASTATARAIAPRMTAAAAEEHRRVEEAARRERRQEWEQRMQAAQQRVRLMEEQAREAAPERWAHRRFEAASAEAAARGEAPPTRRMACGATEHPIPAPATA